MLVEPTEMLVSELKLNECDPNTFYEGSEQSDLEVEITKWINLPLALLILIASPFVIIMPFVSEQLNTTCRKIISLIVLSDLLSTVANMELSWGKKWNQLPEYIGICLTATLVRTVTQFWSLAWTMLLLLYVFLLLQRRFQMKKRMFFIISHVSVFIIGISVVLVTILWNTNYVYSDDYFSRNVCAPEPHFFLYSNDTKCLLPDSKVYSLLSFYIIYLAIAFFAILIFLQIIATAYTIYRERTRSLVGHSTSVGHSVAKDQSYAIFKATFRYAVTSLVYMVCSIPLVVVQSVVAFNGPFGYEMNVVYGVFFGLYQPLVALINVNAYGLFSLTFRRETKRSMKKFSTVMRPDNTSRDDYFYLN